MENIGNLAGELFKDVFKKVSEGKLKVSFNDIETKYMSIGELSTFLIGRFNDIEEIKIYTKEV